MTSDERDVIAALRDAYRLAGSPNGPACASADCLALATTRVFWPVLPGEEYPLYCDGCAAWAVMVLEALGYKGHTEALPTTGRVGDIRGMKLEGL